MININTTLLTITTMIAQYQMCTFGNTSDVQFPRRSRERNVCLHGSAPTRSGHPSWAANGHDFVGADEMWSKSVGILMNLPTNSGGEHCLLFFQICNVQNMEAIENQGINYICFSFFLRGCMFIDSTE